VVARECGGEGRYGVGSIANCLRRCGASIERFVSVEKPFIGRRTIFGTASLSWGERSVAVPVNIHRSFTLDRFVRDRDVRSENE
jgi:hypothetical protein